MKQNIVVLFGGVSCEHDISIITAFQTIMNIDANEFNVYPVYICKNGIWKNIDLVENFSLFCNVLNKGKEVVVLPSSKKLYLKKGKKIVDVCDVDCVINCMHGVNGEDGSVSGLLQLANIPYTSSDLLSSGLGIDKCMFKKFLKSIDVSAIDSVEVGIDEYFSDVKKCIAKIEESVGYPMIIKPSHLGSSIGIKVCKKNHDLANFIENALKFDKKVLIEKYFENITEYNIALYNSLEGIRMSSIESPKAVDEILSFNNKYIKGVNGADYIDLNRKKLKLSKTLKTQIQDIAIKVYRELGFRGVVRFDFIKTEDGILYLNEVNTIPGSLANYLFADKDISFDTMLEEQVAFAIHENNMNSKLIKFFESSVLDNVNLDSFNKYK